MIAPVGAIGYDGIRAVDPSTPGAIVCGECGSAWMEDITPAGRCAFEGAHEDEVDRGPGIESIEMTVTFADGQTVKCLVTEGTDAAWGNGTPYLAETLDIRAAVQDAMVGAWSE